MKYDRYLMYTCKKNLQNDQDTGESAMKGHEVDAAAKRGMNDAAQLEHDQWRSKMTD